VFLTGDPESVAGEFGQHSLYKMLGYFTCIESGQLLFLKMELMKFAIATIFIPNISSEFQINLKSFIFLFNSVSSVYK
jgi:hypothetical protein